MLDIEIAKQPDAIEKYFCEPFAKLECEPMDEEVTELFAMLMFATNESVDIEAARKEWQFQVLEKRLSILQYEMDERMKIFIFFLTTGVPGKFIMYLYYLQYMCKKRNQKFIKFEDTMHFLPKGFPSDSQMNELWVSCKLSDGSNLIDKGLASKSILFN